MRILVTGSRAWTNASIVADALATVGAEARGPERITVVHGAARGADSIADRLARNAQWTVEPHPADWDGLGKGAGLLRNVEMVELGADVCLAFILDCSRGAMHCATHAEKAGIPTRRYISRSR